MGNKKEICPGENKLARISAQSYLLLSQSRHSPYKKQFSIHLNISGHTDLSGNNEEQELSDLRSQLNEISLSPALS